MFKNIVCALTLAASMFVSGISCADPTNGPISDVDTLVPGQAVGYSFRLNADELTVVSVRGDGDGDIDCWLYDELQNVVDSDTDSTDYCSMRVVPRWSGEFTLMCKNNGIYSSTYTLRVR